MEAKYLEGGASKKYPARFAVHFYLVHRGCDNRPEGTEDEPDGGRDQHEAGEVDVVVDGVEDGGHQELEGLL